MCERVTTGFWGFSSDWMTKWREFLKPITWRSNALPNTFLFVLFQDRVVVHFGRKGPAHDSLLVRAALEHGKNAGIFLLRQNSQASTHTREYQVGGLWESSLIPRSIIILPLKTSLRLQQGSKYTTNPCLQDLSYQHSEAVSDGATNANVVKVKQ